MSSQFGRLLASYRKSRHLTQLKLAVTVGLDPSVVSKYERGTRHPDRTVVLALAKALGLSPEETNDFLLVAGFIPAGTGYTEIKTALEQLNSKIDNLRLAVEYLTAKLTLKE